jgi:hypothetical protein
MRTTPTAAMSADDPTLGHHPRKERRLPAGRGKILYVVTPKAVIEGIETLVRGHNATTAECLQLARSGAIDLLDMWCSV